MFVQNMFVQYMFVPMMMGPIDSHTMAITDVVCRNLWPIVFLSDQEDPSL